MATKPTIKTNDATPVIVEAAVLRDCAFGPAGAVVALSVEDAEAGAAQGALDLHPESIAYRKEANAQ